MSLTNTDYIKILQFYKKSIPKSNKQLKKDAENILSTKLCKCIKKVDPLNEPRSIGICSRSIFNKKGYTRGKFKCKNKKSVTFKKSRK
jgi:hypothetical protein